MSVVFIEQQPALIRRNTIILLDNNGKSDKLTSPWTASFWSNVVDAVLLKQPFPVFMSRQKPLLQLHTDEQLIDLGSGSEVAGADELCRTRGAQTFY